MIFAATFIMTGFQLVWFHALARLFAVRSNLLPTSPRFEALRARLSVDTACQIGAVFLLMGFVATLASVGFWAYRDFGPLDPGTMTRAASLVAVLSALGVQSVTNGFLWGLLNQKAPEAMGEGQAEASLAQPVSPGR